MRVDAVSYRVHESPRTEPFMIATGVTSTASNVIVRMEGSNLVGYGSACPNSVTKETRDTIVRSLDTLVAGVRGREFGTNLDFADALDATLAGNPAAKAGLDIAFHDLRAQEKQLPLYRSLGGGSRDRIRTDVTIGIMDLDATVAKARHWVGKGFRALKLKVGIEPAMDVRRVRAVREAVGPEVELRADGNQGYSIQSAFAVARELAALGVVVFEQPLPAEDLNGMKVLTESSPVPIMADEMVLTPKDAMRVRWGACAKAVNLKLMKHGGLLRATEVDTVCESAGLPTMVGCMGESVVSVAAGLHFALARGNVRWADLDSHMMLSRDVAPPLRLEGGDLLAPTGPGLGVRADPSLFG